MIKNGKKTEEEIHIWPRMIKWEIQRKLESRGKKKVMKTGEKMRKMEKKTLADDKKKRERNKERERRKEFREGEIIKRARKKGG